MNSSKITLDILENYATQFNNIETCIHDFQVVLNQKNVDDLRELPAVQLINILQKEKIFKIDFHDPFIKKNC